MHASDSNPAVNDHLSTLCCYLVEDSPLIVQSLIDTLEQLIDLKVIGVSADASSACAWLTMHHQQVDVVITDIILKQGNGLDVLKCLQSLPGSCVKVVLTNYATADMRMRCQALGADRVFDKSSELDELISYCASLKPTRH